MKIEEAKERLYKIQGYSDIQLNDGDYEAIDTIIFELDKKEKTINLMSEFIDKVDSKSQHCMGYICTVATTYYPEEERKRICCNCIKNIFKEKAEGMK